MGFFVAIMLARFPRSIAGGVVAVTFEISAYLTASTIGITNGRGLFAFKPPPILRDVIGAFVFKSLILITEG